MESAPQVFTLDLTPRQSGNATITARMHTGDHVSVKCNGRWELYTFVKRWNIEMFQGYATPEQSAALDLACQHPEWFN